MYLVYLGYTCGAGFIITSFIVFITIGMMGRSSSSVSFGVVAALSIACFFSAAASISAALYHKKVGLERLDEGLRRLVNGEMQREWRQKGVLVLYERIQVGIGSIHHTNHHHHHDSHHSGHGYVSYYGIYDLVVTLEKLPCDHLI